MWCARKAWLGQADGIIAARISQIDASANSNIALALGGLSGLERQTIRDAHGLLKDLDSKAKARLDQADSILDTRIRQVNGVVRDAISQADQDIAARIRQADEAAEKAIGSIDVVASKQTLNVQAALLRVGALLGMVAFVVAALRFLFDHVPMRLKEIEPLSDGERKKHRRRLIGMSALSLLAHVGVGAIGIAIFFWLSNVLPSSAQKEQAQLTKVHAQALEGSLAALDFTKVRYHAAQLTILDPDNERKYRTLERRADLIRVVFTRPGLLASEDGVRQVSLLIEEVNRAQQPERAGISPAWNSPDVLTVAGYVRWQLAATRTDELDAVMLCAQALDLGRKDELFILKPLAAQYLRLFLARPVAWAKDGKRPYTRDDLVKLIAEVPTASFAPFEQVGRYDQWVLELDRASTAAYVAMLDAHADLIMALSALGKQKAPSADAKRSGLSAAQNAILEAKTARLVKARAVVSAWRAFDDALQRDSTLASSSAMATFRLNDAPLVQALWFIEFPDARTTAPAIKQEKDAHVRAKMTPVRVAWARRYLGPLGAATQVIAAHEVAARYLEDEKRTIEFEKAYVDYRVALASSTDPGVLGSRRDQAARDAAALGLYSDEGGQRASLGEIILNAKSIATLPSADTKNAVMALNDQARLRLL